MSIKVRYLSDIEPIGYTGGQISNWIDLRASKTVVLKKGEFAYIPLGVAIELPYGYEAIVAPRSSTFKRHHVLMTNSIGVIDQSYCGDDDQWHFPAYAVKDTVINKNDRICQFRIIESQGTLDLETVEHLGNKNRGGLGSTGKD